MKIPINDYDCINLEAPTVRAYEVTIGHSERWIVWCKYCREWHDHGPGEGHRESHCNQDTPYQKTGYNLAVFAGA